MLAVLLLGAHGSGKTTLAKRCMGTSTHTPLRPDSPSAFHLIYPERTSVEILDPKPGSRRTALGRQLSKYTVAATLLTLPRDAPNTTTAFEEVRRWAELSRQHHPNTPLALAVTKTRCLECPLASLPFEQLTLATMREIGVRHVFYTDAASQELGGVHHWLLDVLQREAAESEEPEEPRSSFMLDQCLLSEDERNAQRSCDTCSIA